MTPQENLPRSDHTDVGVLVVHGIGAQQPGETLEKLLAGLRRVEPAVPAGAGGTARATIGGKPVRFYEVYWANLLKDELAEGAFQMNELQSLAWFPLLNIRCGNYRAGSYSFARLAWWCAVLPVLNVLMLLGYYGAFMLAGIATAILRSDGSAPAEDRGISFLERARKAADRTSKNTWFKQLLDEYPGDVFSYVNSAGRAFHREDDEPKVPAEVEDVYARMMHRFYEQLTRAADECGSIQVVAHSLGTVVTFHALSGMRLESDRGFDPERVRIAIAKVSHLYTIGSPLEKIRFLWPRLASGAAFLALTHVRWDNFVSWFDPVAGMLKRFEHWGDVCNHRLLGGGFISGHVVYERSALFLKILTQGLCGRELPLHVTTGQQWRDRFLLAGETLLAPVLLLLTLILGAAVIAATAALLPFIVSLPLRPFVAPETWAPYIDAATLFFIAMMMLAFLVAPLIRARKVHALYWKAPRRGD